MGSGVEHGMDVRWHFVGDRPVRTLVTGTAREGVPELVIVPGLGALGYLVPLARACATWTRVTLLDLPGFGHRTTASLPADLDTVAHTLSSWLVEAAAVPVVLLGHSTGAQSALRAAVHVPQGVALLALGGATFPPRSRTRGALVRRALRTVVHERPGELWAVLPYYLRGRSRVVQLLRTALEDAPELAVPVLVPPLLVLRGQKDHLSPGDWSAELAATALRGRLVVLPGAHNFVWTSPELTSRMLEEAVEQR